MVDLILLIIFLFLFFFILLIDLVINIQVPAHLIHLQRREFWSDFLRRHVSE